jgi:hypothetical protein
MTAALYLDQNYLSGIAKHKPAFDELAPVLTKAVEQGAITVVESAVHERESAPRPDLQLLDILRALSHGRRLPDHLDRQSRQTRRAMVRTIEHQLPERHARASDQADLDALAQAITHCDLVTCDAFMADVIKRTHLDFRHRAELFSGRRRDVRRLRDRLQSLIINPEAWRQ